MGVETRFVAQVMKFNVEDWIWLTLKAGEDQLGRVIHLAAFTGAGAPRAFDVRIVAKDIPGLAWKGLLKRLSIDEFGYTRITMMLEPGFDVNILARMVTRNVAVEVKDTKEG